MIDLDKDENSSSSDDEDKGVNINTGGNPQFSLNNNEYGAKRKSTVSGISLNDLGD